MARVHIDVMLKDEILDPQGQAVQRALPTLGYQGIADVRVGKHIELTIDDDADLDSVIDGLAGELLANPVIEQFTWRVDGA
ncbi:MAG TPA: phosphoribosylformylglycinamidine synthase subunit PurS [Euzebyales bacterium]|nr:phosphoribosylformylglycinamidine synthase subunit PurS [Euzebyales bacterium]